MRPFLFYGPFYIMSLKIVRLDMKIYLNFLILILLFVGCSEPNKKPAEKKEEIPKIIVKDKDAATKKFWSLVVNSPIKAVDFVNSVKLDSSGKVDNYFKNLFSKQKISTTFLHRQNFTAVDSFFYTQSYHFNQIAQKLKSKSGETVPLKEVFTLVQHKIINDKSKKEFTTYPYMIWQRGYGLYDRQAWVFCEIVYQLGGKVSIIYLMNEETKTSPHTICEIEYKGVSYIIDTLYDKFLEKTSFTDLKLDRIKQVWPDNPEIHNCFKNAIRQIPSMPIDYTERNQRLSAIVGKEIRFGEPPQNRYHYWKSKYPKMDTRFWSLPVALLKTLKTYKAEISSSTNNIK